MIEATDCETLVKLFTNGSRHRYLTVINIVQNVFDKGKYSPTISLNSHSNVAFKIDEMKPNSEFLQRKCCLTIAHG